MKRLYWMLRNPSKVNFITLLSVVIVGMLSVPALTQPPESIDPVEHDVTQGALRVTIGDEVVECPLKHTDVKVDISGFIVRATVTQTFHNPYDENIEAVYVFPLPHTAAIDAMTMRIGDRTIVGVMKRRAEALAIYEQALQQGKTASLLEQERPNIFTQSVGNIKPNAEIHIEISYVDVLNYDLGTYEFHFPMVVGPRYIPGAPISEKPPVLKELEGKVGEVEERVDEVTLNPDPSGTGWSPDTTRVPDASRITPPVLKPGYRTGHDIRLAVSLEAGVPIQDIESVNHAAALEQIDTSKARVEISPMDAIPNKDFVMKYKVVGEKPEMAVFGHASGPEQRYFMLMIQPKLDAELATISRELVFLVDVSGSMSGEPMAKVKAAMRQFLHLSKPDDTLQVITFAGQTNKLFQSPVPATRANIARALTFTSQLQGGGGTEMLAGIKAVLNAFVDPKRVRIVVMLTDGYIGNEEEIIAEVGRRAGDAIRFWTIGIGSSPNHFLLDGVAKQGGGMSGVLGLNTNPKELVRQVVTRIHRAQLTNIQIDWGQLAVYETYPRQIPELWAGSPMILFGRYAAGKSTEIEVSGTAEGKPLTYALDVTLPEADPTHDVLAKVWARQKIEDLSAQMYHHADTPEVVEEITRIALDYQLMSQYTSFVAVDEREIEDINQQVKPPRRIPVPVPLPEGVDFEGVFGGFKEESQFFYDQFGKVIVKEFPTKASHRFEATYTPQSFDASAALGLKFLTKPIVPVLTQGEMLTRREMRASSHPGRDSLFEGMDSLDPQVKFLRTYAKVAITEAQALQQSGPLEDARLRHQNTLALIAAGIYTEADTAATIATIQTLSDAIVKKRAKTYPGLNRKLDVILRNQSLADAIRTLVNAGGFQLDLIPGSLEDVTTLMNLSECRVLYLDLRHATVGQGLAWLLAPYPLIWQIQDAETLIVGTARRMPGASVWGYNVQDIAHILTTQFDGDITHVLQGFHQSIKTAIDQTDDPEIKSRSVVLIDRGIWLVYGNAAAHEKAMQFLKALRDSDSDIISISGYALSKDLRERNALKALQKLTIAQAKGFAEQRVSTDLQTASWQLLAASINGEIDLEALTRLQMAWTSPQLEAVVAENLHLAMRSAWCIHTAVQAVPTDMELAALSESVLSKVKQMQVLKSEDDSFDAYLGTLYAVLTRQTGNPHDREINRAIKTLIKETGDVDLGIARLIAEGLLSPSKKNDRALQAALSAHQIYDEDLVLLTCLIAKRRGGQLWQTFWEKLPDIANQSRLSGQVVVIVNRIAASRKHI